MSTPSDSDILAALRAAYYALAISGTASYTAFGRTFEKVNLDDLRNEIAWWTRQVDAATQPGIIGGTLIVSLHG